RRTSRPTSSVTAIAAGGAARSAGCSAPHAAAAAAARHSVTMRGGLNGGSASRRSALPGGPGEERAGPLLDPVAVAVRAAGARILLVGAHRLDAIEVLAAARAVVLVDGHGATSLRQRRRLDARARRRARITVILSFAGANERNLAGRRSASSAERGPSERAERSSGRAERLPAGRVATDHGVLARRGGRLTAWRVRAGRGFRTCRGCGAARGVRGRRGLLPGRGGLHGLAAGAARGRRGGGRRGVLRRRGRGWRRAAVLEDGAPLVAGVADGGEPRVGGAVEIGRASCRERGEMQGGAVAVEKRV